MELRDLDDLARKMSGRPPRPEGEDPEPAKPFPNIKTVPFTEEEYQANKAMREKMGIFHIESVPTEEELDKVLRKGMGRDEVLKLFGKPYLASDKPHDKDFYFIYKIAPEKRSDNPERTVLRDGFKADFSDGKLSWWSHTYSNVPREEKVVGREEPTLRAILPEIDFSSGDLDLVAYVEGIVVPDPKQIVNQRDLGELIAMALTLSRSHEEDSKQATLDADCDFMKTLSQNFPEVAALMRSAKEGRVSIDKLSGVISPYALGEKELPVKIERVEQPGGDRPAIAPESKPDADSEPQPEAEGPSR